jgi:hypothetical protein
MVEQTPEEEREWAAEKRDFVADRRDELAAQRDGAGDERDEAAAVRESALDQREQHVDARAAQVGLSPMGREGAELADARFTRDAARQGREDLGEDRDAAAGARDAATRRRVGATPNTRLASAFAAIAENLLAADSFDQVLQRIAQAAVSTVAGCDMASVTVSEQGSYQTAATTNAAAASVDQAQYDADEGPSLDAIEAPLVYAHSFPDIRWPRLASRPAELGAQSAASYRLAAANATSDGTGGSLNTYGTEVDAFGDEAQQIALILAAHASVAAGAVRERDALQDLAHNLKEALMSRDVIGQAKGILMERLNLSAEDAFDVLRRSSNQLNEKLTAVALDLAESVASRSGRQ